MMENCYNKGNHVLKEKLTGIITNQKQRYKESIDRIDI